MCYTSIAPIPCFLVEEALLWRGTIRDFNEYPKTKKNRNLKNMTHLHYCIMDLIIIFVFIYSLLFFISTETLEHPPGSAVIYITYI